MNIESLVCLILKKQYGKNQGHIKRKLAARIQKKQKTVKVIEDQRFHSLLKTRIITLQIVCNSYRF